MEFDQHCCEMHMSHAQKTANEHPAVNEGSDKGSLLGSNIPYDSLCPMCSQKMGSREFHQGGFAWNHGVFIGEIIPKSMAAGFRLVTIIYPPWSSRLWEDHQFLDGDLRNIHFQNGWFSAVSILGYLEKYPSRTSHSFMWQVLYYFSLISSRVPRHGAASQAIDFKGNFTIDSVVNKYWNLYSQSGISIVEILDSRLRNKWQCNLSATSRHL